LDDPPVKALVVYGANPMSSNPDSGKVRRGLEREDLFTVVLEQFPTDTVDRRHRPSGDDADRTPGPARGATGTCICSSTCRRRAARRVPVDDQTFRRLARRRAGEPSLYDSDEQLVTTLLGSGHVAGRDHVRALVEEG
jgi:hypothetical protein